jgi:hypothetical protein
MYVLAIPIGLLIALMCFVVGLHWVHFQFNLVICGPMCRWLFLHHVMCMPMKSWLGWDLYFYQGPMYNLHYFLYVGITHSILVNHLLIQHSAS